MDLTGTGLLGQVIAQESTAAIGSKTNQAIINQLDQFTAEVEAPLGEAAAKEAKTRIVQTSSQIAAGFAQNQKQMFSSVRFGS